MFAFENSEQNEIRQTVRKLVTREIVKYQNDKWYNTVPRELFDAFGEIGLTGLVIPEKFGGSEEGPLSTSIAIEELAAVDLGPAIFMGVHFMVSGLINRFGSEAQKKKYLTQLASAKMLGAFALTEPAAGSDAAALQTTAKPSKGGFIINGTKCYISSASFADIYIVFARTSPPSGGKGSGISAFLVEAGTAGLTFDPPEKKMGCELSPIGSMGFEEVEVPKDSLLGELDQGYSVALGGLARGRINIAACANGLSRSAIETAVRHLKERKQFGHPLAEFQALQFMLADMQMKLEASRLLTWQAATHLEKEPESRENRLYPSIAKCFSTDSAMSIATDAVQLLGGAGYIKDYQVERIMREAKMLQIVEGTNQIQRVVIAREMLR